MADDTLMTADDPGVSKSASTGIYGLYFSAGSDNEGDLVLSPDSFIGYSYSNESRISQYPQEAGAFQQYNKVDTPFDVRIRMTKGGKVADVAAFIEVAESLVKATDLTLYDMITPERQYRSCNVTKVLHDHQPGHGANMVTMDIHLLEIRVTASAQYSNTASPTTTGNLSNAKSPAATDPKNTGTVQPAPVVSSQTQSIINAITQAETAQNHAQMSH